MEAQRVLRNVDRFHKRINATHYSPSFAIHRGYNESAEQF
jgi:hypothetical protein